MTQFDKDRMAAAVVAYMTMTLQALSIRLLALVSLIMSFGFFAWAMSIGSVLSLIVAATFTAMVFIPILWRDRAAGQQQE